jgi:hypothetical protein
MISTDWIRNSSFVSGLDESDKGDGVKAIAVVVVVVVVDVVVIVSNDGGCGPEATLERVWTCKVNAAAVIDVEFVESLCNDEEADLDLPIPAAPRVKEAKNDEGPKLKLRLLSIPLFSFPSTCSIF